MRPHCGPGWPGPTAYRAAQGPLACPYPQAPQALQHLPELQALPCPATPDTTVSTDLTNTFSDLKKNSISTYLYTTRLFYYYMNIEFNFKGPLLLIPIESSHQASKTIILSLKLVLDNLVQMDIRIHIIISDQFFLKLKHYFFLDCALSCIIPRHN